MTEAEWLACDNSRRMVDALGTLFRFSPDYMATTGADRKLRLFAVACIRHIWALLPDGPSRAMVDVAERYADGNATRHELRAAHESAEAAYRSMKNSASKVAVFASLYTGQGKLMEYAAGTAASAAASDSDGRIWVVRAAPELAFSALLIRDIFGNPFRSTPSFDPVRLAPAVVGLARSIYDARAFDRMPELAGALEGAGCADADVLAHCRGPGPHVRGCWVVDLILRKS